MCFYSLDGFSNSPLAHYWMKEAHKKSVELCRFQFGSIGFAGLPDTPNLLNKAHASREHFGLFSWCIFNL